MSKFERCSECGNYFKPSGISGVCPRCRKRNSRNSMVASERGTAWGSIYQSIDSMDWNIFTILFKIPVKIIHWIKMFKRG